MVMSLKHLSLGPSQLKTNEVRASPDAHSHHCSTYGTGAAQLVFSNTHPSMPSRQNLERHHDRPDSTKLRLLTSISTTSQHASYTIPVDNDREHTGSQATGNHLALHHATVLSPAVRHQAPSIRGQYATHAPSIRGQYANHIVEGLTAPHQILTRGMSLAACKTTPFVGVSLAARKNFPPEGVSIQARKISPPSVGMSLAACKTDARTSTMPAAYQATHRPALAPVATAPIVLAPARPQVQFIQPRANVCKTRAMQTAMSAAREHALSPQVLSQGLSPSDIRSGDTAVLMVSSGTPAALHGKLALVTGFAKGRIKMKMRLHEPATDQTIEVSHFLTNLELVGLPHNEFTTVRDLRRDLYAALPPHVVDYILGMTTHSGRYHALRALAPPGTERHLLNAIFDCGANIFISSHRGVFDRLRKCLAPTLVSVCGDGIEVLCTHWGYVTMVVGKVRRTFEGFFCAYATDTTIVPAGWWDTLPSGVRQVQYYFRGRNHTLELWQEDTSGERLLGASSRNIDPSNGHSDQFRNDLEQVEGQRTGEAPSRPLPTPRRLVRDPSGRWTCANTQDTRQGTDGGLQ